MDADQRARLIAQGIDPDTYVEPTPAPTAEHAQALGEALASLQGLLGTPAVSTPAAPQVAQPARIISAPNPPAPEAPVIVADPRPWPTPAPETTTKDTVTSVPEQAPVAPTADKETQSPTATPATPMSTQVGGDHYTKRAIQPLDYIVANDLGFIEGNVVKYVTRWKDKDGVEDLKKARDYLDKYITYVEETARS